MTPARPFLKWVGGKRQLLPQLLERFPEFVTRYHEPFLGGGALFWEWRTRFPGRTCHLSDANRLLIETYCTVRDTPEAVIEVLMSCLHMHSEKFYYALRDATPDTPAARAARFIYINRAGFNGLWRVNKAGKCNVPWGKHARIEVDFDNLRACSRALEGADISWRGFEAAADDVGSGSFVYMDPPYVPVTQTASFTAYTPGGFGLQEQMKLVEVARNMQERGGRVLLSNADVPLVHELYKGWKIERVSARRNINSKGTGRGPVGEVLIS